MTFITSPITSRTTTDANNYSDVADVDNAIIAVVNGNLDNSNLSASAGIAHSKLASSTAGNLLIANGSGVITGTVVSGDVTITSAGVTAIGSGKVTSAKIADGTIVAGDLASNSVTTAKITDANVTAAKLSSTAVTPSNVSSWPAVQMSKSVSQAISDSTSTAINFTAAQENLDTDTMHDNTNQSRITLTTAGAYIVTGNVQWTANGTGRRELSLRPTVSGSAAHTTLTSPPSGAVGCQTVAGIVWTSAPLIEYVELVVYQTSGGSLDVTYADFSAHYLGKGT